MEDQTILAALRVKRKTYERFTALIDRLAEMQGARPQTQDATLAMLVTAYERGQQGHTMQAAIALSPTNKAMITLENGDTAIVQEYAHERYRLWVVPPGDIPMWAGTMTEREIDELPTKYQADPGKRAWEPMGYVPDASMDYSAMETALQALTGQVINLRTELLVIKAEVVKNNESQEPEE